MKLFIRVLFIIIISIFISACHEKDYDIISEARKIFSDKNFNESTNEIKEQEKIEPKKKEEKILPKTINKNEQKDIISNKKTTAKIEKKKSRILEDFKEKIQENEDVIEKENIKTKDDSYSLDTDSVKVGVMLPLTGENQKIGNMILNAIEMAIFQNEENKLELLIKDTEADPKIAKKRLLELVDERVNIVIGPLFSKTLAAIQGLSEINQVNILALTNNKNLARKGIWIFGIDPQAQTNKALQFALEKGAKNIAALLPKNAYGLLLFDTISNFSEKHAVNIKKIEFYEFSIESQRSSSERISKGFNEYQEYLDKLNDDNSDEILDEELIAVEKPFDCVFIAASGQNLTVLSSQLQYNNVDPKFVQYLGISSWENKSILNEPALEGGVFVTTSQLYQKKIKLIYKNSFNKEMPNIAMIAYDILALISSLNINKNNGFDISNIINTQGYIGLRGLFRLKENGVVERTFDLKQVKKKKFKVYKKARKEFTQF